MIVALGMMCIFFCDKEYGLFFGDVDIIENKIFDLVNTLVVEQ